LVRVLDARTNAAARPIRPPSEPVRVLRVMRERN